MADEKLSIADAVSQAHNQLVKEKEQEQAAPKEEEKKGEEKEEKGQEEEEKEEDEKEESEEDKEDEEPSEFEVKQALALQKVLRDPAQARLFAQSLLSSVEDRTKGATKEDKKEEAKALIESLEGIIGEDNKDLLKPIISIFTKLSEKREQIIAKEFERIDNERAAEKLEIQTDLFIKDNKINEKELDRLAKLVEEMPQSADMPLPKYLGILLKVVRAESPSSITTKENGNKTKEPNKEKIRQNLKEKEQNEEGDKEIKYIPRPAGKKITPKDALEMAMHNQRFEGDTD